MIYFIQQNMNSAVKIGYTENLEQRLSAFKTSIPYSITVLGTVAGGRVTESGIHQHLSQYRLNGEWFEASSFVLEYIFSFPNLDPYIEPMSSNYSFQTPDVNAKLQTLEKQSINNALEHNNYNKSLTAKKLDISRSTLYAKIKKYCIEHV